MLYKLAHIMRDHCSFVWNAIEGCNAWLFTVSHGSDMEQLPDVLKNHCGRYIYRLATVNDASALAMFFASQPSESFTHFRPHGFDERAFASVFRNKAFLPFVVCDNEDIIGYFFLRCFITGKAFRGKFVDARYQCQGIATEMGHIMTDVANRLHLRVYGSISPDNYASLCSATQSNEIRIIKKLDNGYYYIEFLKKQEK